MSQIPVLSSDGSPSRCAERRSAGYADRKWYRLRRSCASVMSYLLDSEVHTYAFSVAANAIISFIPFIVLLYTIVAGGVSFATMVEVVGEMVHYFLPSNQDWVAASLANAAARHGVQWFSLVMILISCTGIFLPLEVALNQAWGVSKSRNYLLNQLVAFGLAMLMVVLAMGSILLSTWQRQMLAFCSFTTPTICSSRASAICGWRFPPAWPRFCSSSRSTGCFPTAGFRRAMCCALPW